MILRSITNIDKIAPAIKKSAQRFGLTMPEISGFADDLISLSKHFGKRIENLRTYNSKESISKLFLFNKKGEIIALPRTRGSKDLEFLDHIRTGNYTSPSMQPQTAYNASQTAIEQSNRLAKEFIPYEEKFLNGYRYSGSNAKFDSTGKYISRFSNGNAEIVIIDRIADTKLAKAIDIFKQRVSDKRLSEQDKMSELLKFVDEVFSVKSSGHEIENLTKNMHSLSETPKEVMLGEIMNSGAGVCRHRALLTKILGDEIGLKTSIIQGYYSNGGHAWNEILIGKDKYLFDGMHRTIFDISNTQRSVMPQVFHYKITDPKNQDKIISRYLDQNSPSGLIYRSLANRQSIKTNAMTIEPNLSGESTFKITPHDGYEVFVNSQRINSSTPLMKGDWVQINETGFQI